MVIIKKQIISIGIVFLVVSVVILTSCACRKLDDKINMERRVYLGNELKLDGYYYTQFNDIYRIVFFYKNGILFSGGDVYLNDISEYEIKYANGSFWSSKKDDKLYWGVFNIEGNSIKFEKWYPSSGGGLPIYIHSGQILNDTTFIITKSMNLRGKKSKELNETYHFKKFSPKPDSTNSFIE